MIDRDLIVAEPLRVGSSRGQLLFDLLVGHDAACHGVYQEHLSRLQAAFHLDLFRLDLEHPCFRSHDHVPIVSDHVAPWAQAVAIQDGSDHSAIGECDGRRTIPRLHQTRMVFVEGAFLRLHVGIPGPRFGHKHGHRVRQAASRLEKKLDGIVEVRGIAAVWRDDRIKLLYVVAEQGRLQQRLARVHPVDVAFERVDFAVVRDVAIRMRALPTGKGVGGKALMHQTQRAGHVWIGKLAVEIRDLRGQQQALINNGAARKRWDVERFRIFDAGCGDLTLGAFARYVKLAFEGVFVRERATADKDLLDVGLRGPRHPANRRGIHRRIPPAENGQSLLAHNAFQNSFALQSVMFFHGQECHAHAVGTGRGQFESQLAALPQKERMGNLQENAGAVAGLRIASAGPAVRQVEEHLYALADNFVTLVSADVGHEPDSAGVMLLRRMVQSLGRRRRVRFVSTHRHCIFAFLATLPASLAFSPKLFLSLDSARTRVRDSSAQKRHIP